MKQLIDTDSIVQLLNPLSETAAVLALRMRQVARVIQSSRNPGGTATLYAIGYALEQLAIDVDSQQRRFFIILKALDDQVDTP